MADETSAVLKARGTPALSGDQWGVGLEPGGVGFGEFAFDPLAGPLKGLHSQGIFEVNQAIELLGQARLEVMAPPFSTR